MQSAMPLTCTLVRPNNRYTNAWYSTGEQTPKDRTQLKGKGHSFEDGDVHILAREDRWFERGVKKK